LKHHVWGEGQAKLRLELTKRSTPSNLMTYMSPIIGLALALIAGAIMFSFLGKPPLGALYAYFIEPISEMWSVHELLIKAAPLILMGAGLCVCYQSNNWNIGAEGQMIMGGMAGSILPVMFPQIAGPFVLPAMLFMGVLGGMAYAAIPALLKTKFKTNEILTSLMLVYIAQLFLDWTVRGAWRNPQGLNFPETRRFDDFARIAEMMPADGRANFGFVIAVVVALAIWVMMAKSMKGFQVKVIGASPKAARFAGFDAQKMVFFAFLLAGATAGLAGIVEVAGASGQLRTTISPGYGFTAIIVAFLGRLNPIGAIVAGLVLALTFLGGEAAQISLGVSDKVARVFQGLILFFVLACDTLILYRIRLVFSAKPASQKGAA